MLATGVNIEVIELLRQGDSLITDVAAFQGSKRPLWQTKHSVSLSAAYVEASDDVLAVVATTSCFAPREPDLVVHLGKVRQISFPRCIHPIQICNQYNIPMLVNNAYGVHDAICTDSIDKALRLHDGSAPLYVVQSTDKNFMVPVGGSIISSDRKE